MSNETLLTCKNLSLTGGAVPEDSGRLYYGEPAELPVVPGYVCVCDNLIACGSLSLSLSFSLSPQAWWPRSQIFPSQDGFGIR
eukprot:COSAG01_NODE_1799_length_9205_cov_130.191302_2_plen_83_part_00